MRYAMRERTLAPINHLSIPTSGMEERDKNNEWRQYPILGTRATGREARRMYGRETLCG